MFPSTCCSRRNPSSSTAWILGSSVALVALALILDLTCRDSAFVDAVLYAAFPIAMLASEIPSARRRAGFVGVLGCVLAVIAMYAAFVGVVLFADRI